MLQTIRDRASGVVAYAIVILISIPFALWGINQYFGGGDALVVAEVNGNEIPLSAFTSQYQQQRRYLRSVMGGKLPPGYDEAALKQNVIRGMVREALLAEDLERAGYRVSDGELARFIGSLPAFQDNGHFDRQRYERVLETQRRSKAQFEAELRGELRRSQFENGIRQSAFLPQPLQREYLRLKGQQRDIAYFVIPADVAKAREQITEAQIESYFKDHSGRFQTPERVKLAYVELDEAELLEDIDVDEAALRQFYEGQADRYMKAEERRARHILVKPKVAEGEGAVQAKEQAREQALELVERLRKGEDFAALARQHSDDQLSAPSGGELGVIARGDLEPNVDQALFGLAVEEISDPVESAGGFEILQVLEVKPAEQQPFEALRDRVEREYRQRLAERRFIDMADELLTLSYEQSDSLEPAAQALGLPTLTTGWVTRQGGEGIAANPKVREAAFSEDVLQAGRNSELVELSDTHVLVLRVAEHESAQTRPLEAVREEIRDILARETARKSALETGRAAVAQIRQGVPPGQVAEGHGRAVEELGFVPRTEANLPTQVLLKAFALNKPAAGEISAAGAQLPDGGYAVVVVHGVREGEADPGDGTAAASRQAQGYGTRELEAAYTALEAGAEVRIFQENL
jgi:peptidyl-prolyl cis-trans isomerase D